MTSEQAKEFAKKLMTDYDLTPDMEDDLKKLIDSIDEREGIENSTEKDTRIQELEKQLADSKQKYIDRFFGGQEEKVEEIKEEVEEDDERDGEVQSFDELFEEREGK